MRIKSKEYFKRALKSIPGGVNSPVRACKAVKADPIFFERGEGAYLIDVDGNRYIDYVCSWGPLILGHAHPEVIGSIYFASKKGTSFGAPTWQEVELAELIKNSIPSIEKIRLVNSGTEATMSAIRLARAYTGRKKIIKFEGCYHGHVDSLLVKAGSGLATFGIPATPGVPEELTSHTLNLPFNDFSAVEKAFLEYGKEIAAVIVEPIPGNMGVVLPENGFLEFLREITQKYKALLIFDEVITGFRIGPSGAQGKYGINPDLTCLGKIIGGGLPVGAYGGKEEIMNLVSPEGPVYQAGTLSGNPIAVAAGIATLKELLKPGTYERLEYISEKLEKGIREVLKELKLPYQINRAGSMLTLFFTKKEVKDFQSALTSDTEKFAIFWQKMLEEGIYLPPSQFEAWFVSLSHGEKEIEKTISAIYKVLKEMH
ncbi:Glutamate-1-semialdehyde 2,1-aminomutase [Thermodesulfobacterium geofontis OPF15]|jgi:glutamate-1-semialdehyde 2,1-aminomutase|uniref:Glutamate-1-semialdehyde 2,1-aminomutase n=1 Tax=Thermodesulfobacterium geofontis (strain OPF15) TaxID=795359 RepID=F8C4Y0_THEGP|nr:glutamate-1-semialdehyde 2,1-aminomutase [Thermodesulfobacterium geofontis]AEH22764.1 Glutamate-1-semialdehyde 2,1-aminomutase [Thermodesulfobacterium geofontis OPF15]